MSHAICTLQIGFNRSIATSPSATVCHAHVEAVILQFQSLNRDQPLCNHGLSPILPTMVTWVSIAQSRPAPLQRKRRADARANRPVSIAQSRPAPLQPIKVCFAPRVGVRFNRSIATSPSATSTRSPLQFACDIVSIAQSRPAPLQPIGVDASGRLKIGFQSLNRDQPLCNRLGSVLVSLSWCVSIAQSRPAPLQLPGWIRLMV